MHLVLQGYYDATYYRYFIVGESAIISITFPGIYIWTIKKQNQPTKQTNNPPPTQFSGRYPTRKRVSVIWKCSLNNSDTMKWGHGKEKMRHSSSSFVHPTLTTFTQVLLALFRQLKLFSPSCPFPKMVKI